MAVNRSSSRQAYAPRITRAAKTMTYDVAIVGAGPYGLSAASHLKALRGLRVQVFGQPMSFWSQHMPAGMCLRSPLEGSSLSDPGNALTLDAYSALHKDRIVAPLPLASFVQYGRWFQQNAVPDLDERKVLRIDVSGGCFLLTLQDGEVQTARRVIVASGIVQFASRPQVFANVPAALVSHSCDHTDLSQFSGKRVVVVGGGQSALESAALLHQAGADTEVLVRESVVYWTWSKPWLHNFKPVAKMLYAAPDVGPAGISHIIAKPTLYRRLPRAVQDRWGVRAIRPAGAWWLRRRLEKVPLTTGRSVVGVAPNCKQVTLYLNDGSQRSADHVMMATGYRVNIGRYEFLPPSLLESIQQVEGYPQLRTGFESSVPGLHFLGAPAAWSFGPLMRFVAGADYAARAVASYIPRHEA